jgi:hypothetical protein
MPKVVQMLCVFYALALATFVVGFAASLIALWADLHDEKRRERIQAQQSMKPSVSDGGTYRPKIPRKELHHDNARHRHQWGTAEQVHCQGQDPAEEMSREFKTAVQDLDEDSVPDPGYH